MAKMESKLTWFDVDVAGDLDSEAQAKLAQYKAIYRQMKEAKQAFEAVAAECFAKVDGMEVRFAYNFGKLSVAYAPKAEKPAGKAKGNLSQWLAEQGLQGRAV